MKLRIFILSCVCFSALAQTSPPANPFGAITNRDALRRAMRSGITNAPLGSAASTNAATISPALPPALPLPPVVNPVAPNATPAVPPPNAAAAIPKAESPAAAAENEEIIEAGMIDFPATDVNQVLQIYAQLVKRTILRPSALPAAQITLKTQTPLTKREAIDAFNAVLGMNGITMINVGEKFVKAVPQPQANQAGAKINRDDASTFGELGGYVTHVTQLKFAKPTELVPVLQPFASAIGAGAIQPIDSSQILVLRDYTENVKRMLELIEEIDIVVPSEYVSEVIPIKYALAEDISAALNGLSSGGGGTSIGGRGASQGLRSTPGSTTPGTYPGQTQPGVINPTQSPFGGARTPGSLGAGTPSFSDRLQNIIRKASTTGDFQILGQTKIIADARTNSLLIFATETDMKMIKKIIAQLDIVLAQVLIEAIIMEVSLDDSRTIGFSYLQHPKSVGDFTGVGALKNVPFLNANSFSLGGSGTNGAANGLPSGFSYAGTLGNDLDVTFQAIATDSRVNVLSRPRIQTSHAVPASLFIGNTVPYITGTSFNDFGGGGARSQYQEKRIGITLDVLPLINPDGLVVMDIVQNIQQLGVDKIIDGNPVPTTTERTASAKVAVRDRDTIILGGFISNSKSKSKSGIPFLKDIPLLGYLFRSTSDSNQRVELIVMMRPTVLPTPEAAAVAATVERNKLPGVHRAEIDYDKDEAERMKKFEASRKSDSKDYEFEPVPAKSK